MPKAPKDASETFKVALNVANPEACSWYCPETGVNLFLNKPFSDELYTYDDEQLEAVYRGIKAGILIVCAGDLPEGFDVLDIARYASPRKRTPEELSEAMDEAQAHHKAIIARAKSAAKTVTAGV